MIRLDKTRFTIVVLCNRCPGWRELRTDTAAAHAAGRRHVLAEHAGDTATLQAARQAAYRARKTASR